MYTYYFLDYMNTYRVYDEERPAWTIVYVDTEEEAKEYVKELNER